MKIESNQIGQLMQRKAEGDYATKTGDAKRVAAESDQYDFSPEALSLYEENSSSLTERPVIIIEIKPSPP